MSKVLAITVALMMASIVLMPALGYTDQVAGNQSYTATSGGRVNYSLLSGVPAHNMTQEMVASKYSIHTPAVQSNRVAYSFRQGTVMPYSFNLVGVDNAIREGYATKKAPAVLGSVAKTAETTGIPTATVEPAKPAVNTTPAPVTPTFSIEGMVLDDMNGNGAMDNNETGLADWTVNLEKPAGMVITSVNTTTDGKFMFTDLSAGEYVVSEVVKMGWTPVSPADGKFSENVTDMSVTGLVFANQAMPVALENTTVATSAMPSNVTAP
jgi:hypothetical protein